MGRISGRRPSWISFAAWSGIAAFVAGTRTVDLHVRRLRSKLGPELEHLIETVRGVGYRAADDR